MTELAIPPIATEAAVEEGVSIFGELQLHVSDVGSVSAGAAPATCRDAGIESVPAGQVRFCVQLVDTAGDTSNVACSEAIATAE